ncbi:MULTISPECIES: divalent-cation tolerance protein CutA [Amycolatopsis]|uniref:Divalent-cation tolerance protein CutA n=1 Tax=Amycolatopsis dongchuanensis TaxID=1070866 RepID=A0ABP8VI59_9PSEU
MAEHVVVTTTTDSEDSARELAARAVEAKLGACAQIVPITSVYRWEGEVRTEPEWRVEIKTAADRVAPLVSLLEDVHSYDTPEVIATPIEGGSAEYLRWVIAETR